jgi:two-component system, chemotaxis family, protein-glutamate methylesterase/glutaminase
MPQLPIKVLLVEDSPVAVEILLRIFKSSSEIEVVGTAYNGKEALDLIPKVEPQVICTDLHMAGMDGLELTKQVMARYPRPILVISNSVQSDDPQNIFKLLQAGAVDILPKPMTGMPSDYNRIKQHLITRIKVLSGVKVFTRALPKTAPTEVTKPIAASDNLTKRRSLKITAPVKVVTIGSSTGGPQALQKVLAPLPANFPVPILCTQHISKGFLQGLVDWLSSECKVKCKIAQTGESPVAGTVYFAPDDYHLELNSLGKVLFRSCETVDGHCPSVTVMFKSVAKFYKQGTLGILLTGMGKDGATGMQTIAQAGGTTIAQDEDSCIVFGMPKEAIALGAVHSILPIQDIASVLIEKIIEQQK